jgi:hypothetical protein
MNIPFNIKFSIFDENKPLTQKQIKIRNKLIDMNNIDNDMKKILKKSIIDFNEYKFLDRVEPSISSIDEKKQLRMKLSCILNNKCPHSLHFSQQHSQCKEYLSIEELKNISNRIKNELEEYLHYEIDTPILYIEIDDL